MRILQVYNERRVYGGEDSAIESIVDILASHGEDVRKWVRRNVDVIRGFRGRLLAFFSGVYSVSMRSAMREIIAREEPNVVHAHNLYPLLSPSILSACKEMRVPVVVHYHSHFLTCPTTFHFHKGRLCFKCLRGATHWCILRNCRRGLFESTGYALRSLIARKMKLFTGNTTLIIAMAHFTKDFLTQAGFAPSQIVVLPHAVRAIPQQVEPSGDSIVYVGRLSPEKGVATLIEAAKLLPKIRFVIAGEGPMRVHLAAMAPGNVTFVGWLDRQGLDKLYKTAKLAVVPSVWPEPFGLVVIDAMSYGIPVVASRMGALPEIVDDGKTGLIFTPGDHRELADKITQVFDEQSLCCQFGESSRRKVVEQYTPSVYYEKLMNIYRQAIRQNEGV